MSVGGCLHWQRCHLGPEAIRARPPEVSTCAPGPEQGRRRVCAGAQGQRAGGLGPQEKLWTLLREPQAEALSAPTPAEVP